MGHTGCRRTAFGGDIPGTTYIASSLPRHWSLFSPQNRARTSLAGVKMYGPRIPFPVDTLPGVTGASRGTNPGPGQGIEASISS